MTADHPPGLRHQLGNFVLLQAAWFVAVLGAAHGLNWPGCLAVFLVLCWHVYMAPQPIVELKLIGYITLLGLVVELVTLKLGWLTASALLNAALPAPWLIALWSLFAAAFNVTQRWLRPHPAGAAVLGAIAGPLAYAGGAKLQAVVFVDPVAATLNLAVSWAIAMPLMSWLSQHLDGFAVGMKPSNNLRPAGALPHD